MENDFLQNTISYRVFTTLKKQILLKVSILKFIGYIFSKVLKDIFNLRINIKHSFDQASRFGIDSLPLSLIIVGISGMIIALQVTAEMIKQGATDYIGTLITLVIVREIAPIMGSFAIISMVGSSMAAEIATMKITEQVDAIRVCGVDPINYLITPRVIAGFFVMPSVITISALVGVLGGFFPVKTMAGISFASYMDSVWIGLAEKDIWVSILKAAVFGTIIATICSAIGFKTKGGAMDVGKSTTNAVVYSFMIVVIVDFIISYIFFY